MACHILYVTVNTLEEAQKIAKNLLSERLAACVNMMPSMKSMYWWKDAITEDNEVVMIAKTKEALVAEAIQRIKFLHPYENPCIVSIPIAQGSPAFLDWIEKETRK